MGLVRLLGDVFQGLENDLTGILKKPLQDGYKQYQWTRPIFQSLGLQCLSDVDKDEVRSDEDISLKSPIPDFKQIWSQLLLKAEHTSSSVSNMLYPVSLIKSFMLSTVYESEIYIDSALWLTNISEKLQTVYKTCESEAAKAIYSEDAVEGFENFDDFSDVIKDFIKSVKYLITFDVKNEVERELLVPHFNISPVRREMQRKRIRRFIGRC